MCRTYPDMQCACTGYYKHPATGTFPAPSDLQNFAADTFGKEARCIHCLISRKGGDQKGCRKPNAPFCLFQKCEVQLKALEQPAKDLNLTPRQTQAVAYMMWRLEKPGEAAKHDRASARTVTPRQMKEANAGAAQQPGEPLAVPTLAPVADTERCGSHRLAFKCCQNV